MMLEPELQVRGGMSCVDLPVVAHAQEKGFESSVCAVVPLRYFKIDTSLLPCPSVARNVCVYVPMPVGVHVLHTLLLGLVKLPGCFGGWVLAGSLACISFHSPPECSILEPLGRRAVGCAP